MLQNQVPEGHGGGRGLEGACGGLKSLPGLRLPSAQESLDPSTRLQSHWPLEAEHPNSHESLGGRDSNSHQPWVETPIPISHWEGEVQFPSALSSRETPKST